MSRLDIIRAWKDQEYRESLSGEQRARLPENPAGAMELTEAEAATVEGKASVFVCSGCHGCTHVGNLRYAAVSYPTLSSGFLRF